MKFLVNAKDLKSALQKVSQFSGEKSTLPFTADVFIGKKNDNQIDLMCTNIESIGSLTLDVQDLDDALDGAAYSVGIKALKQLLTVIKPGETGNVLLNTFIDKHGIGQLTLLGDSGHVTMRLTDRDVTEDMRGFLIHGLEKYEGLLPLLVEDFFNQVKRVEFCSSRDEARPVLQGIRVNGYIAATDGFRIARNPVSYEGLDCIIPGYILKKASRLFSKSVSVRKVNNTICFTDENAKVACELIEGNFPNWGAIYPKKWWMRCVVERTQLEEALRLSLAAHKVFGGNNVVKFNFHNTSLIITSVVEGEGESATSFNTIPRITPADEMTEDKKFELPFMIAADARKMKEIVDHVAGENVVLKFNANNTPIVIESEREDADAGFVLTPMHLG